MKRFSIISAIISLASIIIWLVFSLIWMAFNNFPSKVPYFINLGLIIPFICFIASCFVFAYSKKDIIKNEIIKFINNI